MPIVGLNLGKSSFRAIELDKKRNKVVINNFGSYSNPKLNLEGSTKDDVDLFATTVKEFFSEAGFNTSQVIVGLDETHVFMRIIEFPNMNDKELKNSLKYEAEQYIPLPLDQVNISYQKLPADLSKRGKISVQLVAAKKDILEKYVKIVRKAGMVPKAIEPETVALGRILGDTEESPVGTMVLEIGYSNSLIIVIYGGYVRFTRTVPIGGSTFTKAIQQGLDLDTERAEEYKKSYGMDPSAAEGRIFEVLKPIADNLILEVKRANVFFTNHNPTANIKRVIITGGAALMPSFLPYIANNLDIEAQLANPLKNLEISPKLSKVKDQLVSESPMYSSVIGLALKGLS